jgi:hypothetical protein
MSGCKCAIGLLISDEKYRPSMESDFRLIMEKTMEETKVLNFGVGATGPTGPSGDLTGSQGGTGPTGPTGAPKVSMAGFPGVMVLARDDALEAAAGLVEANEEASTSGRGVERRYLVPRTPGNLAGLEFAAAIRALAALPERATPGSPGTAIPWDSTAFSRKRGLWRDLVGAGEERLPTEAERTKWGITDPGALVVFWGDGDGTWLFIRVGKTLRIWERYHRTYMDGSAEPHGRPVTRPRYGGGGKGGRQL